MPKDLNNKRSLMIVSLVINNKIILKNYLK